MSTENYALAEEAIRAHRAVVDDVVSTLRQAWVSGDDPVLYLQGIATAYEQQPAFATGGPGAAMFTICAQMLLEARLELEGAREMVAVRDRHAAMAGQLATKGAGCHCGSHHPQCTAVDLCCHLCPEARSYCDDVDCDEEPCDGDHEPRRCPTTGVLLGNIDTVNGHWLCCGGLYPDHVKAGSGSGPLAIEGPAVPCCGSHGPMCGISSDPCCDRCPSWFGGGPGE